MPIPTAPALFIGLSARVLLNLLYKPTVSTEQSISESILLGVWQGVGVQCLAVNINLAIVAGFAVIAKLSYDYSITPDLNKCLATVIGVLLGVIGTELLSSYIDQYFASPEEVEPGRRVRTNSLPSRYAPSSVYGYSRPKPSHARTVQFGSSVQGGSVETEVSQTTHVSSDITSIGSSFDLTGPQSTTTSMEREIAALRARASLADSERRRYREEREWALEQGNIARAEQMKSEYKRYKALMESCHREADLKLLALEGRSLRYCVRLTSR